MVCDLDNFKQINDLYGHLEGDNLLKDFGARLRNQPRLRYVARMGGDEFVIVAPGLSRKREREGQRLHLLAIEAAEDRWTRSGGHERGRAFCPQDGFEVEPCWPRRIGALLRERSAPLRTQRRPNSSKPRAAPQR